MRVRVGPLVMCSLLLLQTVGELRILSRGLVYTRGFGERVCPGPHDVLHPVLHAQRFLWSRAVQNSGQHVLLGAMLVHSGSLKQRDHAEHRLGLVRLTLLLKR